MSSIFLYVIVCNESIRQFFLRASASSGPLQEPRLRSVGRLHRGFRISFEAFGTACVLVICVSLPSLLLGDVSRETPYRHLITLGFWRVGSGRGVCILMSFACVSCETVCVKLPSVSSRKKIKLENKGQGQVGKKII